MVQPKHAGFVPLNSQAMSGGFSLLSRLQVMAFEPSSG